MSDQSSPSTPSSASSSTSVESTASETPSPDSKVSAPTPSPQVSEAKASKPEKEEVKAAIAEAKRKFKVKIDQEEKEVDEDELLRGYQLRQASDKRFKEASQKHKEAENFMEMLKSKDGLKKVLTHPDIGHDLKALAEDILAEQLEEELMDPKEKEIRQLRREKAELEAAKKEREESERSQREAAEIAGYEAEYVADIESSIKANGLPMNIHTINAMRDYMLMAMENGNEDVKANDVVAEVKRDYQEAVKSLMSSSDINGLVSLIGEETLKKIREYDVARLKDPKKPGKVAKADQPSEKPGKREKTFVTVNEYFEKLKKNLGEV